MRTIHLAVALTLVSFASVGRAGQGPTAAKATGAVTGSVKVDGKPASGVTLLLVTEAWEKTAKPAGSGRTDKEGAFDIEDVPPGKYRLLADAPALVADDVNEDVMGKGVFVEAGETAKGVTVSLHRGGVITGRITDKNNEPVVETYVRLLRLGVDGSTTPVSTYGRDTSMPSTDDRGVYRFYGLLPGTYVVAAGRANDGQTIEGGSAGKKYSQQFYPGVTTLGEARRIEVRAGGEATGVDFSLTEQSDTFTVSGRVVDADTGSPVENANAGFGLAHDDKLGGGFMSTSVTDADGRFRLTGLSNGSYGVMGMKRGYFADPAFISVKDADVKDVEVKMHRGGSISGVAVLDGGDPATQAAAFKKVGLQASPPRADDADDEDYEPGTGGFSELAPDGTFRVEGLKGGTYELEVVGMSDGSAPTLLRVERDGAPTDGKIELEGGDSIDGLRVVLIDGSALVRGHVTFVGPMPAERWTSVELRRAGSSRPTKAVGVEADGQFAVDRVPPGEYVVLATSYFYKDGHEARPRIRSEEQKLTVTDGGRYDLSLTVRADDGGGR